MTEAAVDRHDAESMINLGFWTYIMTDCILFGILFATYAVLHNNTFGGPSSKELFDPLYALGETLVLLVSSFTCGFAGIAARRNDSKKVLVWFGVTFLLGISFIVMEGMEFTKFVEAGDSWKRSGFLSAFFTLVGTHGTHISIGLLWMIVMMFQVAFKGLTPFTQRRMTCLRLFWHFLDIVWIFIFTIVYMMGVI
jgi:cytochrome o ubiquinol oxidase subunit III